MRVNDIVIQEAYPGEFLAIAHLIAEQNKFPERHCLHSDSGEGGEQAIYGEMLRLDATDELCFVMARQAGEMIGAMGSEVDKEAGRGWLRGPFVLAQGEDWESLASALLKELLANLPPAVRRLDSFLNITNEQGNRFYREQGFQRVQLVHVYIATAPELLPVPSPFCGPLKPEQAEQFAALHDAIFPWTYATGERLVDWMDDNHQGFVYTQGDEVLGYLYAFLEDEAQEGVVEFVGVKPEARGQGIGRQLLLTALRWFFEVKKIPQVSLTVNEDLADAQALYEKVGFRLKYTGVHCRKAW